MKGIFWHAGNSQWAAKIGHRHTKAGQRTNALFYFDGEESTEPDADVITDFVTKKREWAKVKSEWATVAPILATLEPEKDWTLPVWFDRDSIDWVDLTTGKARDPNLAAELAEAHDAYTVAVATTTAVEKVAEIKQATEAGANLEEIIIGLRAAGLLPKGLSAPSRKPTIRTAVTEFLNHEKGRIALKIGNRIEIGTFNTTRNNLLICLGIKMSDLATAKSEILDIDRELVTLDNADISKIANHWFTLPGDVTSRRTVKNYFSGLRSFLNWAEVQDELGFQSPKAVRKLLTVNGATEPNVTEADYETLKTILTDAPDRTRMYAMLGLLCGFYQRDICDLTANEVSEIEGETYITGYRSKEDSEAKAGTKIKTTHWVPAEIAKIMKAAKAKNNEWGMYFLNRYDQPMFGEEIEGGKRNAVSKAWTKIRESNEKAPIFKQLRKWGWNELPKFADTRLYKVCVGETLAKRWAGQAGGGVSKAYRFVDYAPVFAAQRRWWREIRTKVGF